MNDDFSQWPPDDDWAPPSPPRRLPEPLAEEGVEVPYDMLQPETLEQLIESFVLREGTDYGAVEASLERKIADVRRQLVSGEAKIVYDMTTDSCSIVRR